MSGDDDLFGEEHVRVYRETGGERGYHWRKAERIPVRAAVAEGDERDRLWAAMTEVWPDYDAYQHRTDRQIPMVVFSRR